MSLEAFASDLHRRLLRLLWGQWQGLGILFDTPTPAPVLLDPEALLLLTWCVGRTDPRLFDATLCWGEQHGSEIDVRRLKTLARRFSPATRRTGEAYAEIASRGGHKGWMNVRLCRDEQREPLPLFLDAFGSALPVLANIDRDFESWGWLRGEWDRSTSFILPPLNSGPTVRLFLRRFIGPGARAEVLTALLFLESPTPQDVARMTGYGVRTVQLVLHELVKSGVARWDAWRGRSSYVEFHREPWVDFLLRADPRRHAARLSIDDTRGFDVLPLFEGFARLWERTGRAVRSGQSASAQASILRDSVEFFSENLRLSRSVPITPVDLGRAGPEEVLATAVQMLEELFAIVDLPPKQ